MIKENQAKEDKVDVSEQELLDQVETDESVEDEYVLTFEKPYTFEGETYHQIDLSGILDLTTAQLKTAEKIFNKKGNVSAVAEMSTAYACIVAHMVSKKPIEFFDRLPAKEGIKVKNLLIGYLYN